MGFLDNVDPECSRRGIVCGFGVNDWPTSIPINHPAYMPYKQWVNMLHRCYGNHENFRRYRDVTVSDEFRYFTKFYEWLCLNDWVKGSHVDKDIIDITSNVYSPDTCLLVTGEVNAFAQSPRKNKYNIAASVSISHDKWFIAELYRGEQGRKRITCRNLENAIQAYWQMKHERAVFLESKYPYLVDRLTSWVAQTRKFHNE